jgi:hypothetical protein
MDRERKTVKTVALVAVAVGITMCKLLLDRETLQAQLLPKVTMVEMLRRFKTTAVAAVAQAKLVVQAQAVLAATVVTALHQALPDQPLLTLVAVAAALLALPERAQQAGRAAAVQAALT